MSKYSPQADAYVAIRRRQRDEAATWFEVARAYDEGLSAAIQNRQAARRALVIRNERRTVSASEHPLSTGENDHG